MVDFSILGPLAAPADADKKLADSYGVTPDMLTASRMSSLGNIGAILLAASQPGPVGQRGQIMSQLAGVSGDANKSILTAQQARLAGMKVQEAQADVKRKAAVQDMVGKLDLTPEQKAWAVANPDQFLAARGQSALATDQAVNTQKALMPGQLDMMRQQGAINTSTAVNTETALAPVRRENAVAQETALAPIRLESAKQLAIVQSAAPMQAKIAALKDSGLTDEMAKGLASGRYIHSQVDDEQGNKTLGIFDASTGKQINAPDKVLTPDQSKIVSSMPATGKNGKPIDYSEATGGSGWIKNYYNIVGGNLLGTLPFKDADTGRNALDQLRTRTVTSLTADIPGRETNQMREQLAGLTVEPGRLLQPDPMAFDKLTQTKSFIDSAVTKQEGQLRGGGYTRAQRGAIRTNLDQLRQLQVDYGTVLDHFGSRPAAPSTGPAPGGMPGPGFTKPGDDGAPQFRIIGVR